MEQPPRKQERKNDKVLYDQAAETLRKYFNLAFRALCYDKVGYLNDIAKLVNFQSGEKWVDLGAGFLQKTAITTKKFPEINIWAMDQSEKMLKRGVENNQNFKGSVFIGDLEALPIAEDSMDGVFVFQVLHHLPEQALENSIQEIFRILKNGGRVAIIDSFAVQNSSWKKKWVDIIEGEYMQLSNQSLDTEAKTYHNISKGALVQLFQKNGFEFVGPNERRGVQWVVDRIRYAISEPLVFVKNFKNNQN